MGAHVACLAWPVACVLRQCQHVLHCLATFIVGDKSGAVPHAVGGIRPAVILEMGGEDQRVVAAVLFASLKVRENRRRESLPDDAWCR